MTANSLSQGDRSVGEGGVYVHVAMRLFVRN